MRTPNLTEIHARLAIKDEARRLTASLKRCAYDPQHTFRVSDAVVPTPIYCGPRCASADGRRLLRQQQAVRAGMGRG
jgi:hypothetical protein